MLTCYFPRVTMNLANLDGACLRPLLFFGDTCPRGWLRQCGLEQCGYLRLDETHRYNITGILDIQGVVIAPREVMSHRLVADDAVSYRNHEQVALYQWEECVVYSDEHSFVG